YELDPKTSKVRIEYTAPSYIVPEKINFRYKLDGFDEKWVEAGVRRESEIMNLKPGSYTFMVTVANSDGIWNPEPLKIEFIQKPAFYQTNLFRFLILLVLFAVIYFPVRSKMKKMETHNEELTDMVSETQEELKQVSEELSSKYASSSLGDEDLNYYKKIIEKYMVEEKPYLDDELTIRKLAKLLEIQPHHLSQVINSAFKMNFYTFVNSYRVKEVIKLMKDPERKHHTILAIAYDSGFKSKSSFNTIFKKTTGKTPSEYRDELDFS
ncbi:MAG TPA: helix-turn-helix domain-containing protein, partial [bacterium]|nr:helix-turn-helix domain-containing protein [bacterium]